MKSSLQRAYLTTHLDSVENTIQDFTFNVTVLKKNVSIMPGVSGYKESRYNLYWPQRKLDLYQKSRPKMVHIYSTSITYLKISPSTEFSKLLR